MLKNPVEYWWLWYLIQKLACHVQKRTWCNVHYNEAGYAYFVKYGYMYYMRDMIEVEY